MLNLALGFDIELAIIRNVPRLHTPYTEPLMDWLKAVIIEACYSWRDVRVHFQPFSLNVSHKFPSHHMKEKWSR